MSLLDDENVLMSRLDNAVFRRVVLNDNPYRENMAIDEYAMLLSVYEKVSISYVEFFIEYWCKDNVAQTNKLMIEELERVGIKRWSGLLEEENNSLGEYVLSLDFPAKLSDIKTFFYRVISGDLEFRCRYPIGDSHALDLIRNIKGICK